MSPARTILAEIRSKNGIRQFALGRYWPHETSDVVILRQEEIDELTSESHRFWVRPLPGSEAKAWIDRVVATCQASVTEAKEALAKAKARLDEATRMVKDLGEIKVEPQAIRTPFQDSIRAASHGGTVS